MGSSRAALVVAAAATLAVYVAVDAIAILPNVPIASAPAVFGYVFMGALVLAGSAGAALYLVTVVGTRIPTVPIRVLSAIFIASFPARWFAEVITSGSGISRSGWAPTVRLALVVVALLAAGLAAALMPAIYQRSSRTAHAVVAAICILNGIAAMVSTTYYATTYIRAYRGMLAVSAALLVIGIVFAQRALNWRSSTRLLGRLVVTITAFASLSFGATRASAKHRLSAAHATFVHGVVAQKLMRVLLQVSPAFHARGDVGLEDTRLSRRNALPAPPATRGRYRGNNLLIVTFDALRADVAVRTDTQITMPNLEALAANAFTFSNAIVNYSHTNRSVLSLLSGSWAVMFPSETAVSTNPQDIRQRTRFPRVLHAAGYETAMIAMSGRWAEVFFDKDRIPGFDRHVAAGPRCSDQVAAFKRFLDERDSNRPFASWVHIFETHSPFQDREGLTGSVTSRYHAVAARADRCLGELLAAVRDHQQSQRTIVIISADHGEALGEHGRTLQHSTCYWHDIHVPMIVRLPDMSGAREIDYPIQLSDLLPTLATLLGVDLEADVDGDDLSGLFERPPTSHDPVAAMAFSQGPPTQFACASVVADGYHLIYTDAAHGYELYDVRSDPSEESNLAADRSDILNSVQPYLDAFRARTGHD